MIPTTPIESYGELVDKFHGIDKLDPTAVGRFAFHAAAHMPFKESGGGYDITHTQNWHPEVRSVLRTVQDWRDNPNGVSRYELAKSIEAKLLAEKELEDLVAMLDTLSAEDAIALVTGYLQTKGYGIATELAPSPLFPDGRDSFKPIEDSVDQLTGELYIPYNSKLSLKNGTIAPNDLREFIVSGYALKRSQEIVKDAIAQLEPIGEQELAVLTQRYGAKAAALLCFERRYKAFKDLTQEADNTVAFEIPPFATVSTDLYLAWKNNPEHFLTMLEAARLEATKLVAQNRFEAQGDLVALRSSAVYSEDGESSTGAGVYVSLAVDPFDANAFKDAVEKIFASTDSASAKSYRDSIEVTEELMGLLMQRYVEFVGKNRTRDRECYWGHANSRGANPNIIDVNTTDGTLLFDKNSVADWLMVEAKGKGTYGSDNPHLHSHPDHDTPLRGAIHKTASVVHAALLAEQLFGKPMQLEFVNNSVVQVRPIVNLELGETMEFPDVEHLVELAAVGVGDIQLEYLHNNVDNTGKEGYIVFDEEYEYSMRGSSAFFEGLEYAGYRAFPDKGVVVILQPSSSGHIQAICREKGLICVYPATSGRSEGEGIDELDDLMNAYDSRGFFQNRKTPVLRFVSDGYKARIYTANQEKE